MTGAPLGTLRVGRKRVTVVTVVRDDKAHIEGTITSVLAQPREAFEYVVVDGASTDGTAEIIRSYADRLDAWISEPDRGIYDAMNKGIELATGDGLLFLNSGDILVSEVLAPNLPVPCYLRLRYQPPVGPEREQGIGSGRWGLPHSHQGIVFPRSDLRYSLAYRIGSDYDYFLRHHFASIPMWSSPGYVLYDNKGLSVRQAAPRDRELRAIIRGSAGRLSAAVFGLVAITKRGIRKVLAWSTSS